MGKREFVVLIGAIIFSLLGMELILGYYAFKRRTDYFALPYSIRKLFWTVKPTTHKVEVRSSDSNPFLSYSSETNQTGYRLHPFIDYTRFYGRHEMKLDYFGFRNEEDLYFDDKDHIEDDILVVVTGGSEAAGFTHRIPIGGNLEQILNKESKQKFRVLNLGMNGYTISNEIDSYVHLAYRLKPEFVISHTGFNDLWCGMGVPYNFKKLGLYYQEQITWWLPRLYDLKDDVGPPMRFNEKGYDIIVDKFLENVEKYKNIVESNKGTFILGIQTYEKKFGKERSLLHEKIHPLYEELSKKVSKNAGSLNYINFTHNQKIHCVDSVHTDEKSSTLIAELYAKLILAELQKQHGKKFSE